MSRRMVVLNIGGRTTYDILSGLDGTPVELRSTIGSESWSGANIGGMSRCQEG